MIFMGDRAISYWYGRAHSLESAGPNDGRLTRLGSAHARQMSHRDPARPRAIWFVPGDAAHHLSTIQKFSFVARTRWHFAVRQMRNARSFRSERTRKKYHPYQIFLPLTAYDGCVTCDHNKTWSTGGKNGAFQNYNSRGGARPDGLGWCSSSPG